MTDIDTAIHWWLSENCKSNKEIFGQIRPLIAFLFQYADTLHLSLKCYPLTHTDINAKLISGGTKSIYIINKATSRDFYHMRANLALIGDIYSILRQIKKLSCKLDNDKLETILMTHLPNLNNFRYARNFFAHLDERLGDKREEHGVTGELDLQEIGITFKSEAQGCFYLAFGGDTIYYHDKQRWEDKSTPKSILLSKKGISPFFILIRELYDLFTSHQIHAKEYLPSSSLYLN